MISIDPANPLETNPLAESAVNPSATDLALLDYLDGLLHDGHEDDVSLDLFPAEATPNIAVHGHTHNNVTALPTVMRPTSTPVPATARPRPMRVVEPLRTFAEPRPFAEPPKALPLRMPVAAVAETTVTSKTVTSTPVAPAIAPPAVVAETPVAPVLPDVIAATPVPPKATVSVADEPEQAAVVDTDNAHAWAANGRPQWAQQKFECLIFTSGGLKLAVPLVELGSIYPLEREDITGIFGQIDWFMGLMRAKNGNIRVVDTAQIVMPERYQSEMAAAYHFVVSLNNTDWALGVDAVVGTEVLDPEAVRWRGERSKRPWLAGTVISQMCALLDVAQLSAMFNQLDRKRGDSF